MFLAVDRHAGVRPEGSSDNQFGDALEGVRRTLISLARVTQRCNNAAKRGEQARIGPDAYGTNLA
jgi:hypothetical protein